MRTLTYATLFLGLVAVSFTGCAPTVTPLESKAPAALQPLNEMPSEGAQLVTPAGDKPAAPESDAKPAAEKAAPADATPTEEPKPEQKQAPAEEKPADADKPAKEPQ